MRKIKAKKGKKKSAAPTPRNADKTRARILARATTLFARHGYEGTPISQIIAAAGVNQRMIYHYFGDKRGLYRAIFLKYWGDLKVELDRAITHRLATGVPTSGWQMLQETLETVFDFMARHRNSLRLLMWEGLEGGEISQSIWTEVRGPLFVEVAFLVQQAQQEGKLDPALDPAHLIVSFLGAIGFYFAYAPTLVDMLGKDPFSKEMLVARRQHVHQLLGGLKG